MGETSPGKPVLVVDGQMGQTIPALGAVRSLALAGRVSHVATSQQLSVAASSRHCAARVPIPLGDDPLAYAAALNELAGCGEYDAVLLSSDAAILALGWSGAKLVDKSEVARRSAEVGFTTAGERTFATGAELVEKAASIDFPVAVKPVTKDGYRGGASGSRDNPPVFRADSARDLAHLATYADALLVQTWQTEVMHGVSGVFWEGRLRALIHQANPRTWPYECGMTSLSVSIEPRHEIEERLPALLEGHNGIFNVQYIGDHLLDVNPRVYGTVLMAGLAGINLPDITARLTAGEDVAPHAPLRAQVGLRYRWLEGDLRSLVAARRASDLSWRGLAEGMRPVLGTVHGDASLGDPMPSVARVRHLTSRRLARRRVSRPT